MPVAPPIGWPQTRCDNLGRNGFTRSRGLQCTLVGTELFLEPIGARGDISKCRLVVPVSSVDEVIKTLQLLVAGPLGRLAIQMEEKDVSTGPIDG